MIIDITDLNGGQPETFIHTVTDNQIVAELDDCLRLASKRNKKLFKSIKQARHLDRKSNDHLSLFKVAKYIEQHQDENDITIERKLSNADSNELNELLGLNSDLEIWKLFTSMKRDVEITSIDGNQGDFSIKESAELYGLESKSQLWKFLFENKSIEINKWLSTVSRGFESQIQPGGKTAVLTFNKIELITAPLKRFEVIEEVLGGSSKFTSYENIRKMLISDNQSYTFKQVYECVNGEIDLETGRKPLISEDDLVLMNRALIHKKNISDKAELLVGIKSGEIVSEPEVIAKISLLIDGVEKIRESSKEEIIIELAKLADEYVSNHSELNNIEVVGGITTALNNSDNQAKIIKKIKKAILDERNAEKAFTKFSSLMKRADKPKPAEGSDPKENPQENDGFLGEVKGAVGKMLGNIADLLSDGTHPKANPFGDQEGKLLDFSFRPADMDYGYGLIQICPASFQEVQNFAYVLNTMPYIVIQEFYMKNTASDVADILKETLTGTDGDGNPTNKTQGDTLAVVKEKFMNILNSFLEGLNGDVRSQVISLPWKLYHKLKTQIPGNEYHLPYIAEDQYIAKSSNESQWTKNNGMLTNMITQFTSALSSNSLFSSLGVGLADIFPAPTWSGAADDGDKFEISMTLTLFNDDYDKARYNYMFANSIIHNNRIIQKSILTFPGALYKIVLPTGTRCMMCTGDFALYPIGINRIVPLHFFQKPKPIGAVEIGVVNHNDAYEVIPDAYKLTLKFKSCINANLNETIFGYYLDVAKIGVPEGTLQQQKGTMLVSTSFEGMQISDKKVMTLDEELLVGQVESDLSKCSDVYSLVQLRLKGKFFEDLKLKSQNEQDQIVKQFANNQPRNLEVSSKQNLAEKYSKEYIHLIERRNELQSTLTEIQSNIDFLTEKRKKLVERKKEINISKRTVIIDNLSNVDEKLSIEKKHYEQNLDKMFDVETNLIHLSKLDVEKMLRFEKYQISSRDFSYYEKPENNFDAVELAKWSLMTAAEREVYLMQLRIKLEQNDPDGIYKTKDWKLRSFAIGEIYKPALEELSELIRDYIDKTDDDRVGRAMRKYKLIKSDLDLAFDTSKDFKPRLIYISDADRSAIFGQNQLYSQIESFEGWGDYIFSDEASTTEALDTINDLEMAKDWGDDINESENSRRSQTLIESNWGSEEKFLEDLKTQFNKFDISSYDSGSKVRNKIEDLYGRYEDDLEDLLGDKFKADDSDNEHLVLTWKDVADVIVRVNLILIGNGFDKTKSDDENDSDLVILNNDLNLLIKLYNDCFNVARENAITNYVGTVQRDAFEMFERLTHGYYSEKDRNGKYSKYNGNED